MLHFSVPDKACLAVCSVTLLACSKLEVRASIEEWRQEYSWVRPHSAPNYRSPAPEVRIPVTLAYEEDYSLEADQFSFPPPSLFSLNVQKIFRLALYIFRFYSVSNMYA